MPAAEVGSIHHTTIGHTAHTAAASPTDKLEVPSTALDTPSSRQDAIALDEQDELREFHQRFQLPPGQQYLDGNSLGALPKATPQRISEVHPAPPHTPQACVCRHRWSRPHAARAVHSRGDSARSLQVVSHEWGTTLIGGWNKHKWTKVGEHTPPCQRLHPALHVCDRSLHCLPANACHVSSKNQPPLPQNSAQCAGPRIGGKLARLLGAREHEVVACDTTSLNLYKALACCLQLRPDRRVILSGTPPPPPPPPHPGTLPQPVTTNGVRSASPVRARARHRYSGTRRISLACAQAA